MLGKLANECLFLTVTALVLAIAVIAWIKPSDIVTAVYVVSNMIP